MTAQFQDLFRHQGQEFSLVDGASELFKPADFQLAPIPASTGCWRGTLALYTILDARLVLETLWVNLSELQGPIINGSAPGGRTGRYGMFNNVYQNIDLRIPHTGSLLIANEFIPELYIHMGFHPAWKYRKVLGLMFEDGKLLSESDLSEAMARIRLTMQNQKK